MTFQVRDICITPPGWKPGCYVILHVNPSDQKHPYTGVNLANRKTYKLSDKGLIKIGQALPDLDLCQLHQQPAPTVPLLPGENSEEYRIGQLRARYCAAADQTDMRRRWELLAAAKPGDLLQIWDNHGSIERIKFHNVLPKGQKYVFLAETVKGKLYRYPLNVLVVEGEWQTT